jgi:hypothetical protein
MRLWLTVVLLLQLDAPARADNPTDLLPPVRIQVAGKPIDIETGPATPFLGDLNGDGVQSLLAGQSGDGKLRVYRNLSKGKQAQPKFDSFSWFLDGQSGGRVPATMDTGFTPFVVDLDGDGYPDVLSGSATGDIYLFRGKGDGKFADGVTLKDKANQPVNMGRSSTVSAFDWDGDGVLDLLVGTGDGQVYLIPNEGTTSKYAFGKPKRLEADGKPIQAALGYAHPLAADWDADGRPGLLVGTGAGSVLWYANIGTRSRPKLAAPRTLVPESALVKDPSADLAPGQLGLRARIGVTDWNQDGRLDLLVGDRRVAKHHATVADREAERKARHELARLQRDSQNAMQKLQELDKPVAKETAKNRKEREKKIQSLNESLAKMQKDELLAQKNLARLAHPVHSHGYIWLFLRQSSPGEQ